MSKNTSVTLGDHYNDFIARKIASGEYGSASEVIRAGLRYLEDYDARMKTLRDSLRAGEESGYIEDFNMNAYLKDNFGEEK